MHANICMNIFAFAHRKACLCALLLPANFFCFSFANSTMFSSILVFFILLFTCLLSFPLFLSLSAFMFDVFIGMCVGSYAADDFCFCHCVSYCCCFCCCPTAAAVAFYVQCQRCTGLYGWLATADCQQLSSTSQTAACLCVHFEI